MMGPAWSCYKVKSKFVENNDNFLVRENEPE